MVTTAVVAVAVRSETSLGLVNAIGLVSGVWDAIGGDRTDKFNSGVEAMAGVRCDEPSYECLVGARAGEVVGV